MTSFSDLLKIAFERDRNHVRFAQESEKQRILVELAEKITLRASLKPSENIWMVFYGNCKGYSCKIKVGGSVVVLS